MTQRQIMAVNSYCKFRQPLLDLQGYHLLKPHQHACLLLGPSVQQQWCRLQTDEPNLGQLPGYVSAAGTEHVSFYAQCRHYVHNHAQDPEVSSANR